MGFWNKLRGLLGTSSPESDLESPAAPAGRVTPQEAFIALFLDEARSHPAVERAEPVPDDFAVRIWRAGAEQPWTMFLGNLFHEAREDAPEEKLSRIRRFLSTLTTEPGDSWEEAAPHLVPLVRLATFGVVEGATPLSRPFVPFVSELVGVDSEHSVAIVNRAQVDEWGQSLDVIFATALETLAHHVRDDDIESYDPEAEYAIWHVTRDDSYECSRLALPGFLESFRGRVSGNPIAIVPNRSTLIVSGDGDARAIARLARSAEAEFIASPRAVSAAVYTVDASGTVIPFHLPSEHAHHFLVERGHRVLAATCYADQKVQLEKRFEAENVDIFVATLSLREHNETKKLTTAATFTEGVKTLLPEADLIVFVADEGWLALVPWATVFELAGDCFERDPELDPPRFLTLGWPRSEVLAELRARAIRQKDAT